jgi:hypothetical protein
LSRLNEALADRYLIERELGQGGMATVHLARDLRHDRLVALKVLRPELLAVIGAARFLAEIKTTASLQHPHILPLHDSGEVDGTVFYVMPYVDGESLRDRLERERQLPVDDAVRIAREVAGALDYAHRRGVIHRDIKPENILLHEGQALVADFGIALAVSRIEGGTRMTETGMSLGTPHYMSPEQAMGDRSVDARADVYALGCVLYEMLTGEPPFTGPTAQAIVARVLTDTPRSLRAQRQTIPPHVEAAVHKALQKLPADRFATAADFGTSLGDVSFRTEPGVSAGVVAARERSRVGLVAAGVALVALGMLAAWGWLRPEPQPTSWTFISHPRGEEGSFQFGEFAIAPDGQSYVYRGPGEGTTTQLWIKRRGELHAAPLRGTSGAYYPFFSPDGQWLAFYVGDRIMKMPASGGAPAPVATGAMISRWADWLPNNRIVFGSAGYGLADVDADGGAVNSLFTLRSATAAFGAVTPFALPGSRGDFVFAMCTVACGVRQMWVFDASAGDGRLLMDDAYPLGYAEGHLLYGLSGALFAAPFDLDRLELTGPGIPVIDNVLLARLSASGTLLYTEGTPTGQVRVEMVTREGTGSPIDSTWMGNFMHVSVSPDGRRVAVDNTEGEQQSILVREIEGGATARLSFDGKSNMRPVWHPDGSRIAWVSPEDSSSKVLVKRADGVGPVTQLLSSALAWEAEWSRDGEWIVYRQFGELDADDIFAVRTRGDTTPVAIATSRFYERGATLSPDGRYVAYVSNESSRDEVYVRPFPGADANRWVLSAGGGSEPRWSPLGDELFYVSEDEELLSVPVTLGDRFAHGAPRRLFSVDAFARETNSRAYDVTPDGKAFVMLRPTPATFGAPILVENWTSELRRKLRK